MTQEGDSRKGGAGTGAFERLRSEFRTALKSLQENCQSLLSTSGPEDLAEFGEDLRLMKEQSDRCLALAGSDLTSYKILEGAINLSQIRHDLVNALYIVTEYASEIRNESPRLAERQELAHILSLGRYLDHLVAEQLSDANIQRVLREEPSEENLDGADLVLASADDFVMTPKVRSPGLTGTHLLVVDDDTNLREILRRRLGESGEGASITLASDGAEALKLVEEHDFDTVILDVDMPRVDGLETLRRLRERYPRSRLPVVMSTGRSESSDIVEAFRLGANDYLTKPIDLPVAVSRIQTQVALKRATEDLERRNLFIRSTLGRFLTDEVVDTLLDSPDALRRGGEKRKVTILLSDLRGFTSLSERAPAEQVVEVLNDYLEAMISVITQYGGTIDEIIGDSLLVLFGAPGRQEDHAERAAACAIAMQRAMSSVNDRLRLKGYPSVSMGIGLSTGEVVVGVIGSVERSKYGIIGRFVNLAARVESCTIGGQILMSEYTRDEIASLVETGSETTVEMKGFDRPVRLVELWGIRGKYALSLPRKAEVFRDLTPPIPIEFSVLDGKVSGPRLYRAWIESLSVRSARFRSENVPPNLTNLRLRFQREASTEPWGDVYAKVTEAKDEAGSFVAVFTAIPPEVEAGFRKRYLESA